jgi:pimeloyl-ACP methyl ester carboxylesterase
MMKVAPSSMLKIVAVPASLVPALQSQDRAQLNATIAKIFPVSQRRLGMLNDAHNQTSDEKFALERITTPTLLISAADDLYRTLPNAQIAAARIPSAKLIAFETGGHLLLGRGSQVWPAVAEFIRR